MKGEGVLGWLPSCAGVVLALVSVALLGCADPGTESAEKGAMPGQVTYAKHVAPIMFEHCAVCHRKGEAGPFQLLTYRETKRRAKQIVDITKAGIMPPWLPERAVEAYRDERNLSLKEINMIERWVQQGSPEGDPADLPPIPEWTQGWQMGEPDLVVGLPEPFELTSQGLDVFHTYVIPVPITSTKYVATAEVRPKNRRVVHHALMLRNSGSALRELDAAFPGPGYPGTDLADAVWPDGHMPGWLPGRRPFSGREDIAWKLEPGDDVVLQLHMNPSGKPELVSPEIGFYWADKPPERQATLLTLKRGDIDIAPGEKHYKVQDDFVLPVDLEVLALQPHAHYLGTTMRGVALLPDGTEKLLLDIRQWDFNWQDRYEFVNPVFLPKGTVISILYEFDNSAENERNPSHPPERVLHGWNTKDEMAELWLQVIPTNAEDLKLLQKASGEEAKEDRLEEFLLAAQIAVEQRPFDQELDKQIAGVHAELGHLFSKQGRLAEAEEQLKNALGLHPQLAKVQDELGVLLANQDRWLEAIPYYEEAIREQPRLTRVHVNLALALEKAGKPAKAQKHYKRAIKLRPERADYHSKLGEFHLRQGERQKAIDSFQKALKLDPSLGSAQKNLVRARASSAKSK